MPDDVTNPAPQKQDQDEPPQPANGDLMGRREVIGFGVYFVLAGLLLFYLAIVVWPPDFASISKGDKSVTDPNSPVVLFASLSAHGATGFRPAIPITYDRRLLLMVFVLGALGSYIHTASSFADYAGNRRLVRSWVWWYVLRSFIGAPTASAFYFVVRAGFMSASAGGGEVNRFGIAAIAILTGMFSMKATDKLGEVFDVLFKTPDKRKDTLQTSAPVLNKITPPDAVAGSPETEVTLDGANFAPDAVVLVNGDPRKPSVSTATSLKVTLTVADLSKEGKIKLAVKNPSATTNNLSAELEFTVKPKVV